MPCAIDPNAKFPLVLDSDADNDPAPKFIFRYLDGSEWMDVADLHDSFTEAKTGRQALQKLYDLLRIALVGWENMGDKFPYDPTRLEKLVNPGEAKELLGKLMEKIKPDAAAKN